MSTDLSPSIRLAMELEQEEMARLQPASLSEMDLSGLDDETRQSIELAMRLEEEERQRVQEQAAATARLQNEPEDEESLALAIRMQQEDDESALRDALGVQEGDEDPGSPSGYSYEQLMRLQDTVGMVSRGASSEDVNTLCPTMTIEEVKKNPKIVLGEKCSICQMEWESGDVLRCLPCGHAEHAECLDQWLGINKSCPLCGVEVKAPSAGGDQSACVVCPPPAPMAVVSADSEASTPLPPSAPLSDGTNMQVVSPGPSCV